MTERYDRPPGTDQVAAAWQLGRWRALEHLAAGRNNDSFHLVTNGGEYVLRRLRQGKSTQELEFELELIRRLAASGLPMAQVVRAADGAEWHEFAGRLWTVGRFVPSDPTLKTAELAGLAGDVLARFHLAVAEFSPAFPVPDEQDRLALAAEILGRFYDLDVSPALQSQIERSRRLILQAIPERNRRCRALTAGIIHGGCRVSSLLLRHGRVAALLDMDSARHGPLPEDLAIALASFAKRRAGDAAMDASRAEAFCRGYRARRPIGIAETEAVPVYLAQALIYAHVKALERVVLGADDRRDDIARGAWRLAAAEHALDRPGEVVLLVRPKSAE